jgi:hypothetical protein
MWVPHNYHSAIQKKPNGDHVFAGSRLKEESLLRTTQSSFVRLFKSIIWTYTFGDDF